MASHAIVNTENNTISTSISWEGEEPLYSDIQSIETCDITLKYRIYLKIIQLCNNGGFATCENPTLDKQIAITYMDTTHTHTHKKKKTALLWTKTIQT